jgi:hypothetical protein
MIAQVEDPLRERSGLVDRIGNRAELSGHDSLLQPTDVGLSGRTFLQKQVAPRGQRVAYIELIGTQPASGRQVVECGTHLCDLPIQVDNRCARLRELIQGRKLTLKRGALLLEHRFPRQHRPDLFRRSGI